MKKNLISLGLYLTFFFLIVKWVMRGVRNPLGISVILAFFAGLLNAIYREVCDIKDNTKEKTEEDDETESDSTK